MKKPFAFHVIDFREHDLGVYQTLIEAVKASQCSNRGFTWPDYIDVSACYENGIEQLIDKDLFSFTKIPTEKEALDFINSRIQEVEEFEKKNPGKNVGLLKIMGCGRCHYEDSIEKQTEDYIKSAQREWLSHEEIKVNQDLIYCKDID